MDERVRFYFGEKAKPVEQEEVELIRDWLADNPKSVVVNFGGAGEIFNSVREETKKGGGKYLVVDPTLQTQIIDKNQAQVQGSLEIYIDKKDPLKNKLHSIIDDLEIKVDVIEMNYLIGRVPIFGEVDDAMEYFDRVLKPNGKIIIRNSGGTLEMLIDLGAIRGLGWSVRVEGVPADDFDSDYLQLLGRRGAVKIIIERKK